MWVNQLQGLMICLMGSIAVSHAQSSKPLITVEQIDPQFSAIVSKNASAKIWADGFL